MLSPDAIQLAGLGILAIGTTFSIMNIRSKKLTTLNLNSKTSHKFKALMDNYPSELKKCELNVYATHLELFAYSDTGNRFRSTIPLPDSLITYPVILVKSKPKRLIQVSATCSYDLHIDCEAKGKIEDINNINPSVMMEQLQKLFDKLAIHNPTILTPAWSEVASHN